MTRIRSRKDLTLMPPIPAVRPAITTKAEMVSHIRSVIHRQTDMSQAGDVFPAPPAGVERKSWSERWLDDLSHEA